MASTRRQPEETKRNRRPPATTPTARENQLIALAYDVVEKKMHNGEASSQELTHFLKMGSSREFLEQQRLQMEIELGEKKKEAMASAARVEELMQSAIDAFRSYSGDPTESFDD